MLKRLLPSLSRRPKKHFHLFQIEPSLQCVLECVMCPWREIRPPGGIMSRETFERIAPYFDQAEEVDFTGGGEPLLNPRLVEMIQAAKQSGCTVGFSTNGLNLTPDLSETLVELQLDWISFSVDAATPEVYQRIRLGSSFETVTQNISALNEIKKSRSSLRPKMMMVFVIMAGEDPVSQNYQDLPEYISLAKGLGVEQVIAKNLDVILKKEDDARRVFNHQGAIRPHVFAAIEVAQSRAVQLGLQLRLYSMNPNELAICEHNPLKSLFINWQGRVSPCITMAYLEERVFDGGTVRVQCQTFGDIQTESLPAIWDSPGYQAFRMGFENRLLAERQSMVSALLNDPSPQPMKFPPAPTSCQTCYYLYGV